MTDRVRSAYEIDCPLPAARAKQLLAYLELAVKGNKAMNLSNGLVKIGLGVLTTPTMSRAEAPELLMFLDEAVAQGRIPDVRAGLAKLAVGGELTITLETPGGP